MSNVIENWLLNVALQKGVKRAIQVIVAFIVAHAAQPSIVNLLHTFGLTVNVDSVSLTAGLTTAATAGIEIVRNFAKVKLGFSWL